MVEGPASSSRLLFCITVTIITHPLVPSGTRDTSTLVISNRNLFLQEFYQFHSDFRRFVSSQHVGNKLGRNLHLHL